jgi:hypothetical protein
VQAVSSTLRTCALQCHVFFTSWFGTFRPGSGGFGGGGGRVPPIPDCVTVGQSAGSSCSQCIQCTQHSVLHVCACVMSMPVGCCTAEEPCMFVDVRQVDAVCCGDQCVSPQVLKHKYWLWVLLTLQTMILPCASAPVSSGATYWPCAPDSVLLCRILWPQGAV